MRVVTAFVVVMGLWLGAHGHAAAQSADADSTPSEAEASAADPVADPAAEAAADPAAEADDDGSYWSVSFVASRLTPTKRLDETHDPGLASGLRIGYVGSSGFGFQMGASYSPFPHAMPAGTEVIAHFGMATAAPTYTAQWGVMRLTLGAGGAGIAERTELSFDDNTSDVTVDYAAAGFGTADLELHLFDNGGPMVSASYAHSVSGADYTLYALSAGVSFAF